MTSNFNFSISEPGANGAQNSSTVSDRGRTVTVSSFHTADTDKTRQDKTVLSCPCLRCEIGITKLGVIDYVGDPYSYANFG